MITLIECAMTGDVVADVLPRRGYVGLQIGTSPLEGGGLLVKGVAPGSSAHLAGVREGDVLTHLDANPAVDVFEVRHLLRVLRPGDPLLLDVLRDGRPLRLATSVAAFPTEHHDGARVELGQVDVGSHLLRSIAVVPDSAGPHPCVYMLPGAHWASEEYPLKPEHPVPALAGALARAGFATVRVERSGLGDSQGPPCTRVDFETELDGFRAGLRSILEKDWVDGESVFAFGHSLGAMVAPLLAPAKELAGIACYAASAIPISEGLVGAIRRHAAAMSRTDPGFPARAEGIAELIRLVVCGENESKAVLAGRPDLAAVAPAHFTGDQAYGRIVRFYHQLERVDIASAWRGLGVPALFVHGERDIICTAGDSRALAELVGSQATFVELPGVDHQMSDAPDGAERLAPALGYTLVRWFQENRRRPRIPSRR
jgi:pimeloyl-ACP methyl ester carboxylesterase